MQPAESRDQIVTNLGADVLRDLALLVGRAYPRAFAAVRDRYDETVAKDHYPHERRAMIEDQFAALPAQHPKLRATPSTNKKESSRYYRLSRDRTVLTQSKTDGPLCLPRDADFRRTLAKAPQLAFEWFRPDQHADAEDPDAVYGVLVHGPDEEDCSKVAFIRILIPDAAGRSVLAHIDLFHFWAEGSEPAAFPTVPIAPAAPRLKVNPRQAEDGSGA